MYECMYVLNITLVCLYVCMYVRMYVSMYLCSLCNVRTERVSEVLRSTVLRLFEDYIDTVTDE